MRCFAVLRQLRQIRRSVPTDTFQTLAGSLVLTRLDYSNSVLAGLPVYLVRRLQSVLNAAARLSIRPHHRCALVCLYTGCACRSEFNTRLPFWSIKSCFKRRRHSLFYEILTTKRTKRIADFLSMRYINLHCTYYLHLH